MTLKELVPIFATCITLLGSFLIWSGTERSKRKQENYNRKEKIYAKLIESIKGFYTNSNQKELKDVFITQLNLCWLYSPDHIIRKVYAFLQMVHTNIDRPYSDEEKEKALAELILEMRNDLISNNNIKDTTLEPKEFKLLSAT